MLEGENQSIEPILPHAADSQHESDVEEVPPYKLYLDAMTVLTEGLQPDSRGYFFLQFVRDGQSQADIRIYRSVAKYVDNYVGIQDEVYYLDGSQAPQVNAEYGPEGNLVKFPTPAQHTLIDTLGKRIMELATHDNSRIIINNRQEWVSQGNAWTRVESGSMNKAKTKKFESGGGGALPPGEKHFGDSEGYYYYPADIPDFNVLFRREDINKSE